MRRRTRVCSRLSRGAADTLAACVAISFKLHVCCHSRHMTQILRTERPYHWIWQPIRHSHGWLPFTTPVGKQCLLRFMLLRAAYRGSSQRRRFSGQRGRTRSSSCCTRGCITSYAVLAQFSRPGGIATRALRRRLVVGFCFVTQYWYRELGKLGLLRQQSVCLGGRITQEWGSAPIRGNPSFLPLAARGIGHEPRWNTCRGRSTPCSSCRQEVSATGRTCTLGTESAERSGEWAQNKFAASPKANKHRAR